MVAKPAVKANKLRVIGVKPMPRGVKYNIKPTMDVRAMLIPMLKTTRSIVSKLSEDVSIGTFAGNNAFMKAYPGKNSTNITPKTLRT